MRYTAALSEVKGVGPKTAEKLANIGLKTVSDFIEYYPRKYEDYTVTEKVGELRPGLVAMKAKISNVSERRVRRGLHITEAVAYDDSGKVKMVWFNQPYRAAAIKPAAIYYIRGEFGMQHQRLQILNPNMELAEDIDISSENKIVAIYKEPAGLKQQVFRNIAKHISNDLKKLPETLPSWLVEKYGLLPYNEAVQAIHMPETPEQLQAAKERLGFEELLVVMLAAEANKDETKKLRAQVVPFRQKLAQNFVKALPFDLTDSQRKVVWQIYKDMSGDAQQNETIEPMNRLVEGDVGSGKTIIAAMASMMVAHNGQQIAFIAPTEILAAQHVKTLKSALAHSPLKSKIAMLTGSLKSAVKKEIKTQIKSNEVSIIVGTHALLQESVEWHNLGLVIVDEQHRFGVEQRQKLHTKSQYVPHVLCLTATPIPRSLALTVYGELDISIVEQAPSMRAGVDTSLVSPNSTSQMYNHIEKELEKGHQAYIVCPLITESEVLQVASAEDTYKQISKKELKKWRVGLLHGRLKPADKEAIMQRFIKHELDVLVATTVIEVGVDVPNATVMAILGADRFGLAQLHQLRGRVGRGTASGHCFMVLSDSKSPSKRMRAIAATNNGFELAELDLEIRGPGAIYGVRQSGALDLRLVQLSDTALILKARSAVQELRSRGENMLKYKQLSARIKRAESLTYLN